MAAKQVGLEFLLFCSGRRAVFRGFLKKHMLHKLIELPWVLTLLWGVGVLLFTNLFFATVYFIIPDSVSPDLIEGSISPGTRFFVCWNFRYP